MTELQRLARRLADDYQFECQGGPLRNCMEWRALCAAIDTLAVNPPPSGASPQAEELRAANVANLREMVGMAGRHREALLAVRECILALSPGHRTGYDWNADPLFLTLKEGRALNLIDDALKAAPASPQAETSANVRALTVHICDDCLNLRGEMCHEPECRFCRRTMAEVAEYLDVLLIRPIIDGVGFILDEGTPLYDPRTDTEEHPMSEQQMESSVDTERDTRISGIVSRLAAASGGPWQACRMTHIDRPGQDMTPEEIGEYVTNAVRQSGEDSGSTGFLFVSVNTDSGPKDVCHVGNGPTSPANADFIQHAKGDIEWLLAELLRCADFTLPADLSPRPTPEGSTR